MEVVDKKINKRKRDKVTGHSGKAKKVKAARDDDKNDGEGLNKKELKRLKKDQKKKKRLDSKLKLALARRATARAAAAAADVASTTGAANITNGHACPSSSPPPISPSPVIDPVLDILGPPTPPKKLKPRMTRPAQAPETPTPTHLSSKSVPAAAAQALTSRLSQPLGVKRKGPIGGLTLTAQELAKRRARAQRFAAAGAGRGGGVASPAARMQQSPLSDEPEDVDYRTAQPIVGTCRIVEKEYHRTSDRVDPSTVRPPRVLKEALAKVKAHWRVREDYEYACSQLKSIRQDLRVQHIEDDFTCDVYATHARIALEAGDLGEFKISCARLEEMREDKGLEASDAEFTAYKLLHALYVNDQSEIRTTYMRASAAVRESRPVVHAMKAISVYHSGDFAAFFKLYTSAPHMSGYIMDWLVLRVRRKAITVLATSHGPTACSLQWVAGLLSFDDDIECADFVESMGGVVVDEDGAMAMATKESRQAFAQRRSKEEAQSGSSAMA